ncbi:hypothetical protein CTAYLR_009710 [Chrysophaeum taylorii]|uniref:Uncharacterized protein n=1 Tax=Chrysophaeum taylorii TaxID=2483200 RepID=A0AAD7UEK3_9STRA|nr:hypothetical protein CTAYLR_009710 [Chrysophaeum taylorii]
MHAPSSLKWAIGGRREAALKSVHDFLVAGLFPSPCSGIVVGDALDKDACRRIASSCKCVLTTSGPFAKMGVDLVAACAELGTSYVDITGEAVPFVRDSIQSNEELAKATGAKIVHCCGYDSVPSDLLAALAIKVLRERHGQVATKCVVSSDPYASSGGVSGGTIASAVGILSYLWANKREVKAAVDSGALCANPAPTWRSVAKDVLWLFLPGYDADLGGFHCGFVMATVNAKIVRRSRELLRDAPEMTYKEVMTTGGSIGGLVVALVISGALGLGSLALACAPRRLLAAVAPRGEGPSAASRNSGKWRAEVVARGTGGAVVRGEAVALHQDPGYKSTSIMAAETALAVLSSDKSLGGGILTPACFSSALMDRLERHGIRFSIFKMSLGGTQRRRAFRRKIMFVVLATLLVVRASEIVALARLAPATMFLACAFCVFAVRSTRAMVAVAVALILALDVVGPSSVWRVPAATNLSGQVWLVTGIDSDRAGIVELTKHLVRANASVSIACRSVVACETAVATLGLPLVEVVPAPLDLADLDSVASFSRVFSGSRKAALHALVLNADYPFGDGATTKQGLEISFGATHLGNAYLYRQLEPRLRDRGRVVVVGSAAHALAIDFDLSDLYGKAHGGGFYGSFKAYTTAKLANLYFAWAATTSPSAWSSSSSKKKSDGNQKSSQVVVAVASGFVRASSSSSDTLPLRLLGPFARGVAAGARPLVRAALDDAENVRGKVIDAMSVPRDLFFERGVCMLRRCDVDDALRLQRVTDRLISDFRRGLTTTQPKSGDVDDEDSTGYYYYVVLTCSVLLLAGGAAALASIVKRESMTGPPPWLEFVNWACHLPLVHPLVDGGAWCLGLLACAACAPVALVAGFVRWLMVVFDYGTRVVARKPTTTAAVVITGCDSGFGKLLAVELSARGYAVFAGCYGDPKLFIEAAREDATSVDNLPKAFKMDVTSDADVSGAVARVKAWLAQDDSRELLAVVNNAGAGVSGLLECHSISDLARNISVNYLGVARVTCAFLPLIRERGSAKPRIVVVSSMAGKMACPTAGAYCASKHAVLAYAAALRIELEAFGIGVTTVLPTFHRTPMIENTYESFDRTWAKAPPSVREAYGGEPFIKKLKEASKLHVGLLMWDPARVTETLVRVVTSRTAPPSQVPVGIDARYVNQLLIRLPSVIYETAMAIINSRLRRQVKKAPVTPVARELDAPAPS